MGIKINEKDMYKFLSKKLTKALMKASESIEEKINNQLQSVQSNVEQSVFGAIEEVDRTMSTFIQDFSYVDSYFKNDSMYSGDYYNLVDEDTFIYESSVDDAKKYVDKVAEQLNNELKREIELKLSQINKQYNVEVDIE